MSIQRISQKSHNLTTKNIYFSQSCLKDLDKINEQWLYTIQTLKHLNHKKPEKILKVLENSRNNPFETGYVSTYKNSSYIISVLHSIFSMSSVVNLICEKYDKTYQLIQSDDFRLFNDIANLIESNIYNNTERFQTDIDKIVSSFNLIFADSPKIFKANITHDAFQFLNFLFRYLNQCMLELDYITSIKPDKINLLENEKKYWIDFGQVNMLEITKCQNEHVFKRDLEVNYLNFRITNSIISDKCHLIKSFVDYFGYKLLYDKFNNRFYCTECKMDVNAWSIKKITSLPSRIVIKLDIFYLYV